MNKVIQFAICLCLFTTNLLAKDNLYSASNEANHTKEEKTESEKDTLVKGATISNHKIVPAKSVKAFRNFKSLEQFDTPVVLEKEPFGLDTKEGFQFNGDNATQDKKWHDMAHNVFKTLDETKNYIEELTNEKLNELPVAIKPVTISNVTYTVGIGKTVFKPTYTELTVFLRVELPRTTTTSTTTSDGTTTTTKEENNVLILGASNIKLSHEGGIIGDAKLNLISQFTTNINSGAILLTLKGSFNEPGTYATIDCFGFKEFGIDANIKFTDGLLFPVDKDGKKKTGYVESDFKIVASDWNDMVVNISLPEFGITGLEGTTFRLNTAVFDFSDLRNDEAMPGDYLSKYYSENPNLWRGVYINTLEVVLPKAFEKKNNDKRIAFGATDLIIDGQGVTGKFTGNNIFTLDEGSASGWDFSLDHFLLDIEVNKLKAGEFAGEIVLPVSEVDKVKYTAIIQPDEYSLRVESTKDISFDVWSANVTLTKDSYIEMKVKDDKFRPKASLNGSVSIISGLDKDKNASSGSQDNTVDFKGIVFEEMVLQTESPKFSVAYFGYRGEMKLANFPLTVNEIGLRTPSDNKAELVFDFNINLTSEGDGGNGGGAKLAIKGVLDQSDGRDHWKYDGIDLERIFVQMQVAGMELKGAIFIFEDDETYGTGFAGAVGAKFTTGMSLEVEAKALFGRTPDFRYWFADASVTLPQGIPIYPGFALNKFGGGFYNRMKMAGVTNQTNAAYNQIGASLSGVIYEPYSQNGFGMKASVGIITQNSEELFHATVEFGMAFLRSGGLQEIYFKGHGELLADLPIDYYEQITDQLGYLAEGLDIPAQSPTAAISADVYIGFDFVNDVFHSTSELYVNFGVLKGVGPNGRAGWMDFYVGPDEWHILVGTPNDPLGVALDLGILKLRSESYFMTGDNIPGSPPPPDIVANILGVDVSELDYTRDLNMLEAGKGMAFGANWSMSTGDLRFLIFYARFDAGIGFDIMLKDYGDAHCKGSSEQIGLNGWYANGQSYAYLQGEVGLKFKLFGRKKKITIFAGGGALLMQSRLPNPVWLRGYLGGSYNLLGGLIKGRFRFKVELGDKCEIVGGSALDGIVVIGNMSPKEGETDVDVFAAPQVPFNLQINKVFELPDDTGDRKYRILMDKFEVTKDGQPIAGKIEWNNNNDVATFYSHEILPPNTSLKAYVQLHFEEYVGGKWETITDDGKVSIESKEVNFTTGEAPETIPMSNIAFMYPTVNQKNFFTKEYNKGYINLKRGQSYLFEAVPTWDKTMTMSTATGTIMNKNFGYSSAKKQVTFNIPEEIATQTNYNVKIKLVPEESNSSDNVTESYTTQNIGGDESGNEVEIKSRTAEEVIIKGEERELLTFDFETSQYTTFDKKMNAMNGNKDLYEHVTYPYGLTLLTAIDPLEPFDIVELVGNKYSGNKPLIVARAIMDNSYYQNEIYPLLYQNYPIEGIISVSRDTDEVSVPPVEGVEPMSWYLTYLENDYSGETSLYNPYRYNLTHYYHQDYEDLRYQLVSSNLPWETMPQYKKLIIDPFPLMRKGKYKTKLQYVLPGQVTNGGDDTIKYTNPIYE
ncbi:hypothetical protein [Aquimarina sediminis]|uniref:hypothetical protein n=1 Tax=Aquimarina sediminis TaxID=2070536 RepID=UPI000CA0598C|nr:hypothetical protein [Aquimarina sediminis]